MRWFVTHTGELAGMVMRADMVDKVHLVRQNEKHAALQVRHPGQSSTTQAQS